MDAVAYRVLALVSAGANGEVDDAADDVSPDSGAGVGGDDTWAEVGVFETEQVRYGSRFGDLAGEDVEGVGVPLGLTIYLTAAEANKEAGLTEGWHAVSSFPVQGFRRYYVGTSNSYYEIYRDGTTGADMPHVITAGVTNDSVLTMSAPRLPRAVHERLWLWRRHRKHLQGAGFQLHRSCHL